MIDGEEIVVCETCGKPTAMADTKRCNGCWEVEFRLDVYASKSRRARAILAAALDRGYGVGVPALIARECSSLRELLIAKNEAYGNAALDPVRIFSKADPEEQLRVRIDDKLSRLVRGQDAGEDVVLDLLGYLILLRIARRINAAGEAELLEESLAESGEKP